MNPSISRSFSTTQNPSDPNRGQRQLGDSTRPQDTLSPRNYEFIRSLIYHETRINLGDSKRELVTSRVGKRLRATGCPSFDAYCRHIKDNPNGQELFNLIDAISTNHTFFFREINHFKFLNDTILPQFANGQLGDSRKLKIWSCACSTGEEPYSVALSLADFFGNHPQNSWSLDCSDISNRVLEFASKGIYDIDRLKHVPESMRSKYFQRGEREMSGYCRVRPELSKQLSFRRINLFGESFPWIEKFQVIFCRNVMIYFDKQTQEELVGRLAKHLVPGGYLLIGHAESLSGITHPYAALKPAIYQLK